MGFSLARRFALLGLLAGLPAVQAQPPFLVRDVNTTHPPLQRWDWSDEMEAAGGKVFFVRDDGVHGKELWVSDGVSEPHLVRDILPGARSSNPSSLIAAGTALYFIADDGVHGREIWKSDGSAAGTVLALDFNPSPSLRDSGLSLSAAGGPWIFALVGFGDLVFLDFGSSFSQTIAPPDPGSFGPAARVLSYSSQQVLFAFNDGEHGVEPWVLNKAFLSSTMLGDLNAGTGNSIDLQLLPGVPQGVDAVAAPWGGFLFVADDGVHGRELWSTDGTAAGTHLVKDILPGAGGSYPLGLTALNGAVYFHASGPEGDELWRTDGTAAGTTLVKDINPGANGSDPLEITAVGNQLFFLAFNPTAGTPLWRSDGTAAGTVPVHSSQPIDFCCSAPGTDRHGFSNINGQLVFLAGTHLWRSDGTDAGTVPVADVGSSAAVPMEDGYAVAGGSLYLRGGTQGEELWKSDGTAAGTARILSGPALTSSFYVENGTTGRPGGFAELNGEVCFAGYDGSARSELWKSDGTVAGTVKIDSSTDPEQLHSVNNRLVFLTFGDLRSTDGTPGGTESLSATTLELTRTGDAVYFRLGSPGGINGEPWKTDGTPEGTGQIADIVPGSPSSDPRFFTVSGGKLFLQATDGTGAELWVSDGTAGASQVADLEPGAGSSSPQDLTDVGGLLFFTADTSGSGRELWKSDGTGAGTVMVKDIQPGAASFPSSGTPGTFAAPAGGPLFFTADDGANGEELWKSDGTDAGTVMLKDIMAGGAGSQPRSLTVVGNRVFFVANDGDHGRELWVSDGTPAGTHLVKDIVPGAASSLPYNLTAAGSVLVFSAFDGAHGVEAWRSDGTALGTRRLADLAPGPLPSSPFGYTVAGSNLFFAANDNTTGFELWAVPTPSVLSIFADVPTTYWAWRFVEALARGGVTSGCSDTDFCPGAYVNRAQMAIFVLTARGTTPPPATGTRFDDVPPGYWAGPWIKELAKEGVVSGCSANPPLYCPDNLLTRAEMAVLLTLARGENPPPATGTRFGDVPANYWAARFIEQLAADGVTSGCGGGNYCPEQPITRGEMAVFLAVAFHLPLP